MKVLRVAIFLNPISVKRNHSFLWSNNRQYGGSSISGTGADSIRSYFENVHGTIIGLLASLVSLHSANCLLYKQDYQQNIDQDLHAIIHETELNQIKRSIQNNKTLALTVNGEVQYGLYNTMIESIPGVEHDETMNVYISECISLLALCEKQCMGYYMV